MNNYGPQRPPLSPSWPTGSFSPRPRPGGARRAVVGGLPASSAGIRPRATGACSGHEPERHVVAAEHRIGVGAEPAGEDRGVDGAEVHLVLQVALSVEGVEPRLAPVDATLH